MQTTEEHCSIMQRTAGHCSVMQKAEEHPSIIRKLMSTVVLCREMHCFADIWVSLQNNIQNCITQHYRHFRVSVNHQTLAPGDKTWSNWSPSIYPLGQYFLAMIKLEQQKSLTWKGNRCPWPSWCFSSMYGTHVWTHCSKCRTESVTLGRRFFFNFFFF